jgi:DNA-binding transcriptional ArsR family regulator
LVKRGLTDLCYGFFSTLANPTRLAILEALGESDMSVTQLADSLEQEQSMVSHNLRPLERCKFIDFERRGKSKVYSLNRETVEILFKTVENHAQKHCLFGGTCPDSH